MHNIIATKDYDQFSFREENRSIIESHVKSLMFRIEMKNMLHLNPIIVNQDMEVVEGQHRLEAAKRLQVPIYYVIDDSFKPSDIITLNTGRKNWSTEDYLNFYVAQGYEEYQKLQDFMKEFKITKVRHAMLWQGKNARNYLEFKNGQYKFEITPDLKKSFVNADLFLKILRDINFRPKSILKNNLFLLAIKKFFTSPFINSEFFFDQFEKVPHFLRMCTTVEEYLQCLAAIHNYRMRQNTISIFTKNKESEIVHA